MLLGVRGCMVTPCINARQKKTVAEDMVVPRDRGTPIYTEKEPPILRNFQISTTMGTLPIGLSLASHLHESYPGSARQPA